MNKHRDQLIIYLRDITHPDWAVICANGTISHFAHQDTPEGLAHIANDKIVTLLVPGEDVLLTTAKLPKMNHVKLLQAIPYALEDQLVTDVEQLHFALGPLQAEGVWPVAVVAKEKMRQWLSWCTDWQLKIDALMPVTLALPLHPSTITVCLTELALVRTGEFNGFACDRHNLSPLLQMALAENVSDETVIYLHNYTEQPIAKELDLATSAKEELHNPDHFIVSLAETWGKTASINLLQASFQAKSTLPKMNKIVQLTAYCMLVFMALLFLSPSVSYFILRGRERLMNNQIEEIYKHHFPQAKNVVAPKLRMQEKLQKLESGVSENRLFQLLAILGMGLQEAFGITLKNIDYQNNQMTVELAAQTSEDFSIFTDYLTKQGLNVKQENANVTDNGIKATLLIE